MIDKMMPQNMMQPMTPVSENSGIASGMMPEPPPPEGMQMMQQMAGQMEQVYSGLDSAEDIEDVINAMRGDDLPLSERYSELANLVGPDDAKKTPESVLTVLQPTFQILQAVPDGGIAEAPMGGVEGSEGNFSQPSATEFSDQAEAVLAMSRGEKPVKAANGYYAGDMNFMGANNPYITSNAARAKTKEALGGNVPTAMNNNLRTLPEIAFPTFSSPDIKNIKSNLTDYLGLQDKLGLRYADENVGNIAKELATFRAPFAPKAETAEELLTRRKEFMGDTDTDDTTIQGYLALADAGSRLASTPGSLLTGLTQAAGPLAANLSKIQAKKSEQEREAKGAAFDASLAQEEKLRQFNEATFTTAVTQALDNEKTNINTKNSIIATLGNKAFDKEVATTKAKNGAILSKYNLDNTNNNFKNAETWAKENSDGTIETLMFYPNSGMWQDPETNTLKKGSPPEAYRKISQPDIDDLFQTGRASKAMKALMKSGKPQKYFFPQKNEAGITTSYIRRDGVFAYGNDYFPDGKGGFIRILPGQAFRDDGKTLMEVVTEQGIQYRKVKDLETGKSYMEPIGQVANPKGAALGTNSAFQKVTITDENKQDVANKFNVQGELQNGKTYGLGNSYLYELPESSVYGKDDKGQYIIPKDERGKILKRAQGLGEFKQLFENDVQTQKYLDTFGIKGGFISFVSGNVAGLFGDTELGKALTDVNSEEYKSLFNFVTRMQKQALILSSRYAVYEQQQIEKMIPQPGEILQNPLGVLAKTQAFHRMVTQDYLTNLHLLNPEVNPNVRIAKGNIGNEQDPYDFTAEANVISENKNGDRFEYNPNRELIKRVAASGKPLKGLFATVTREQAKLMGLPPNVWQTRSGNMKEKIVIRLKTLTKEQEGRTVRSISGTLVGPSGTSTPRERGELEGTFGYFGE
jgi:hypothetical protein